MRIKITVYIAVLHCFVASLSAQNHTVSGYIRDADTKEVLIGGNVYEAVSERGCFSNQYGFYSLILPKGKGIIRCSFLGYEDTTVEVNPVKDTVIQIYLSPRQAELQEVVILSNAKLKDMRLGTIDISAIQIKNTPALLGETDLMKSLQLLPGV
ncbi:MAG: carboxypeptidase-like regulatory domain-containing protein, partial [Prevotellaceae bacterium]|nr:carboxypeptidase-like regulatory domain-containing protein [Prevotellaceae bacterium]